MKRRTILSGALLVGLMLFAVKFNAYSLSVTVNGFPTTRADIASALDDSYFKEYDRFLSLSSEMFALSFASTDLIGKAKIKNVEFGVGFQAMATVGDLTGTTATNTGVSVGSVGYSFGLGFAMAAHFGFSGDFISDSLKNFDFIFRGTYLPEIALSGNLTVKAYSVGFKPRWNLIEGFDAVVLGWGGLTLGVAFDYTNINIKSEIASQSISVQGLSGTNYVTSLDPYSISLDGSFFTISPEITTHITLVKIISPFASVGAVINMGGITTNATQSGTILGEAGSINLSGESTGKMVIPYAKAGLEFDVLIAHLTVQGQIAFGTETSYGLGLGMRLAF